MQWLSVDPNIKLEKEVIKLRNDIINSQEFLNNNQKAVKNQVVKHLDWFMASSEVNMPEKVEVLKHLSHLMTNDIN